MKRNCPLARIDKGFSAVITGVQTECFHWYFQCSVASLPHPSPHRFRLQKQAIMNKVLKVVCLFFFVCLPCAVFAQNDKNIQTTVADSVDWEPVMNAIIQVESRGNAKAVSGNSCGAMQITPILVAECNNILKRRKNKKRFKLSDRFSIAKSKEMFLLIQSFHNPANNIERAIRSWNGGMHFNIKRTQRYFEKVMAYLK